ncbi:hypothetical protein VOLCADRAFT_103307 [Volvox carteri f. nagariensis]|uniref:Potassium channel tetramerisation-type BTB domain-containing protein n=1 Tax=Volvox carteri f. nagariensis TaxID=3068 RepID=D8TL68_VOLCA|nr:uncharacterized protein VOLCADRAFT_103307 [Volvox carteri f. nagariensis]EFJ51818.1 hypothetical protein VOLCADRAFT_103307 [Volvox carteri f. nagariensis]|eukprot:XP_002947228.1 hypothetical protein VOLCADRAFT_103307 [Volvox carteri f. nagariensis]
MEPAIENKHSAPGLDDIKLQLLQLQCIIDAKDREIQLLRKQLSSPELHPVSPTSGMTVDPAALVEKLRAVVNGLVAEALASQLRAVGLSPPGPFFPPQAQPQPQQAQVSPRAGTIGSPFGVGQAKSSAHQASGACPPARPAEQYTTIAPSLPTAAAPPPPSQPSPVTSPGAMRLALPGVQIVVQYPLLAPSSAYQSAPAVAAGEDTIATHTSSAAHGRWMFPFGTIAPPPQCNPSETMDIAEMCAGTGPVEAPSVVGAGGRTAVATAASMGGGGGSGGGGSVPPVLELNIDGTVVHVERAVLEMQAAGSQLYRTLIQEYGKLPRDSYGRPYLSYDPRVFQVLMAYLKQRHLFGSVGGEWDWSRTANSLGVSYHYLAQMATHFGLADPPTQPHPHSDSLPVAAQQQVGQATQANGATGGPASRNVLVGLPWEAIPSVHVGTSLQGISGSWGLASAGCDHGLPQLTSVAEQPRAQMRSGGESGCDSRVQMHSGAAEGHLAAMAPDAGDAAAAAAEGAGCSNGSTGVHANGFTVKGNGICSGSVQPAESFAATLPLPPSPSSCPPDQQQQQQQLTMTQQPSSSSPSSRIPPPPQKKPAPAAPSAGPAAAAAGLPKCDAAVLGPTNGTSVVSAGTAGWVPPFPEGATAAPALLREPVDAAAAEAAAMAAAAERYRVPNLYEVLAKKQRTELENEARASM